MSGIYCKYCKYSNKHIRFLREGTLYNYSHSNIVEKKLTLTKYYWIF